MKAEDKADVWMSDYKQRFSLGDALAEAYENYVHNFETEVSPEGKKKAFYYMSSFRAGLIKENYWNDDRQKEYDDCKKECDEIAKHSRYGHCIDL